MEDYLIISFESVNYAMQTESILKNENIELQIMPTPREITLSCGVSIKTPVENLNKIQTLMENRLVTIKELYMCVFINNQKLIKKFE